MNTSLNPLTVAIYQTTGTFIDGIRKDDNLMGKISRHFYRYHKEDYKAELHNLAVRNK